MLVISVLTQKGGAGKTTISTHLARAFQLQGFKVLLADTDQQGSARDWGATSGRDDFFEIAGHDRGGLDKNLKTIIDEGVYDIIVIDGSPGIHTQASTAMRISDLIIIPIQPSPFDLWSSESTVRLAKERIDVTDGGVKAAFLRSRVIKGARVTKALHNTMSQLELPMLNTIIQQRVLYPLAATKGLTAFELEPAGEAAGDFIELFNEIKEMFKDTCKIQKARKLARRQTVKEASR